MKAATANTRQTADDVDAANHVLHGKTHGKTLPGELDGLPPGLGAMNLGVCRPESIRYTGCMTLLTMPVLDVLKALASDVRFEMVRILAHGEHCVCDLEAILELPQSKVSYHLAALKEAGLVSSEQRGKNSYYRLEREPLYSLGSDLLRALLTPDPALTQRIKSVC